MTTLPPLSPVANRSPSWLNSTQEMMSAVRPNKTKMPRRNVITVARDNTTQICQVGFRIGYLRWFHRRVSLSLERNTTGSHRWLRKNTKMGLSVTCWRPVSDKTSRTARIFIRLRTLKGISKGSENCEYSCGRSTCHGIGVSPLTGIAKFLVLQICE